MPQRNAHNKDYEELFESTPKRIMDAIEARGMSAKYKLLVMYFLNE